MTAKAEFQRDCESSMNNGMLNFADLELKVISIARKISVLQSVGEKISMHGEQNYNSLKQEEGEKISSVSSSESKKEYQEKRRCRYFQKIGHIEEN